MYSVVEKNRMQKIGISGTIPNERAYDYSVHEKNYKGVDSYV